MVATYPAAVAVFGLAALAVWIMGTGLPATAPATAPSAVREPVPTGQPEALATT
jgi:hypothetical protein